MNGGRDTARKFAEQQERTNQAIADSKAIIASVGAKSWDTYSEAALGAHDAIGKVDDATLEAACGLLAAPAADEKPEPGMKKEEVDAATSTLIRPQSANNKK